MGEKGVSWKKENGKGNICKIENTIYVGARKATMRRDLVRRDPGVRGEERESYKEKQERS